MKRLIICCDGTWNSIQHSGQVSQSNVAEIAKAIIPIDTSEHNSPSNAAIPQIVFYDDGVGTGYSPVDRFLGGAIGVGIDANILEAYRFLCLNYSPGDEIYLFGYSRGSYTVRSVVGLINCVGLVRQECVDQIGHAYILYRQKPDATKQPDAYQAYQTTLKEFRANCSATYPVPIKLLACWDTVGSLGVPTIPPLWPIRWFAETILGRKYSFHDMNLSAIVEYAIHAIALNEDRRVFDLTPMLVADDNPHTQLEQCWFIGNHGCCGGGTRALSAINFMWVIETIEKMGLALKLNPAIIRTNHQHQNLMHIYDTPQTKFRNRLFWLFNWPILMPHRRQPIHQMQAKVHYTVAERLCQDPTYRDPVHHHPVPCDPVMATAKR